MLNQWDNLQTTLTATQLRNATHHFRPLCIKSHSCANGSLVVFVGDPSLSLPSADGSKFQTKRNQYLLNAVSESLRCKKNPATFDTPPMICQLLTQLLDLLPCVPHLLISVFILFCHCSTPSLQHDKAS